MGRRGTRGRRVLGLTRVSGERVRCRCTDFTHRCDRVGARVGGSSLVTRLSGRRRHARRLLRRLGGIGSAGTTRVVHLGGRLTALHSVLHDCIRRVSSLGHIGRTLHARGQRIGTRFARTARAVGALTARGRALDRGMTVTSRLSIANLAVINRGGHKERTHGMGSMGGFIVDFGVSHGVATPAKGHSVCMHVAGPGGRILDDKKAFLCRGHALRCSTGESVRCAKRTIPMAMC